MWHLHDLSSWLSSQAANFIQATNNFLEMNWRLSIEMWAWLGSPAVYKGSGTEATLHHHILNHHANVLRLKLMWKMCNVLIFNGSFSSILKLLSMSSSTGTPLGFLHSGSFKIALIMISDNRLVSPPHPYHLLELLLNSRMNISAYGRN